MAVTIQSFGFKYGEPYPEADLRIDLRNRIQNPRDHLPKGAVGTDLLVKKTVLGSDTNSKVLEQIFVRVKKLLKTTPEATVAFGCTSGIHRSVVFAEALAERLSKKGLTVEVQHLHLEIEGGR